MKKLTKGERYIWIGFILLIIFSVFGFVLHEYSYEKGRNDFRELLNKCEELKPTEDYGYYEFDSSGTTFSFNCYKTQRGTLVFGENVSRIRWLDLFSEWVEENKEELYNNGGGLESN